MSKNNQQEENPVSGMFKKPFWEIEESKVEPKLKKTKQNKDEPVKQNQTFLSTWLKRKE